MKLTHVWIAPAALEAVLAAARSGRREEPCGLLLGHRVPLGAEVVLAVPVANAHPSPERGFHMTPEALVAAGRSGRARGFDIVGYWHGHLEGPAWPGDTDEEGMLLSRGDDLPPQVHLVLGRGSTGRYVVRAFRDGRTRAKRVPLSLLKRVRGRSSAAAASATQA
jgi:proteasome lid subunit RPN8/RPN11